MKSLLFLALLTVGLLPAPLFSQIRAGGAVEIRILGVPVDEVGRINSTYPVSANGTISMWHIGTIRAAGVEPDVLARKIEQAYVAAEIYTSPTINVIADDGQKLTQQIITVGGKVRNSGRIPYSPNMTIYDAVMSAGGPTEFGAINRVVLYRNAKAYTYDLTKANHKLLKVYPLDTIDVPQKNWLGQ